MDQKPLFEKDAEIMFGVPDGEENEINLMEHRAIILGFPEHAVEVRIEAKVFENGEILNVSKTMNMDEIREAFRKADDGYVDEDDRFVLTDAGAEYLEKTNRSI